MAQAEQSPLRIAVAGSVSSSRRTLQALVRAGATVVGVLGMSPEAARNVSGYCRLDDLAAEAGAPYLEFRNINEPEIVEQVRSWKPDLLFVVGLSQLVKQKLLEVPRLGCVGYHPTWLPRGRGRAPIAWLTLDGTPGAATFFLMDEGADSGPILAQEPFAVSERDYSSDVVAKAEAAIDRALDRWLPRLLAGEWNPVPQVEEEATYHGRRAPEDGLIRWEWPAERIQTLVRASSRDHPGAYTYVGGHKLIVWRSEIERDVPFRGVAGRILLPDEGRGWLVQTGDGLLRLTEVEWAADPAEDAPPNLRVGVRLGYAPEDEIYALRRQVARLEERLARLERGRDEDL